MEAPTGTNNPAPTPSNSPQADAVDLANADIAARSETAEIAGTENIAVDDGDNVPALRARVENLEEIVERLSRSVFGAGGG